LNEKTKKEMRKKATQQCTPIVLTWRRMVVVVVVDVAIINGNLK
jgi:hypothetical protein